MNRNLFYSSVAALVMSASSLLNAQALRLDELKITTNGNKQSREFSFSDKHAGFFYGMTGTDDFLDWNAGWNIRAHRVFTDYRLYSNGKLLPRNTHETSVNVYPDRMVRSYPGAVKETFSLVDKEKVIYIALESRGKEKSSFGIELLGDIISAPSADGSTAILTPKEHPGMMVRVAAINPDVPITVDGSIITAAEGSGGFIITFGDDAESNRLVADARLNNDSWHSARTLRMQQLLDVNAIESTDQITKGISWLMLTADELVTMQHGGWGIYAGLPWFTDFWGRDMFISMPGIVLCTGQFEVARDILSSFAKYMDVDPNSPTYGRVPNRLNLDGILYNTTDGTPRFVIEALDYLRYSGDKAFVKAIYKNVKIATDASLKLYVDDRGYLTHADADTWMDAKRQSKYPCSPRGNRAVDIQALWYGQLSAAVQMAQYMGKKDDAARWQAAADKLKANFENDFVVDGVIVDHLNADGTPDNQIRPNTIYAYELISSDSLKMADLRTTWTHLVYPWGVSSLDQMDENFHPYHEQWHRYHKDDAYHNGTIWLWQNGMAMQRMIEYGQEQKAFKLFCNMNRQALDEGAIGSLAENADAWCRPGKTWVRRSGTFLQAWSNAEQIRTWSQCFLGVKPDMLNAHIAITPRLPKNIDVNTRMRIADADLQYCRRTTDSFSHFYSFGWSGKKPVTITLDLPVIANVDIEIPAGGKVEINVTPKASLRATVFNAAGDVITRVDAAKDAQKAQFAAKCLKFRNGLHFAEPCYREDLKSMSRYFNPPLHYQSIE
ncbi:MAG: amylo-alpha-1,6-glucosidase [Muribaculaceae bacterium]